jgi:uncharacterized protein (TIGR03118 family)
MPRFVARLLVLAVALTGLLVTGAAASGAGYTVTPLVSDVPGFAPTLDPNLVNSWGIVSGPTTPWWVSNQGTSTSTLYNAAGQRFPLPPASPLVVPVVAAPTGIVFNAGTQFVVPSGGVGRFLFSTLTGTIQGWPGSGPAQIGATKAGAVYTGLAINGNTLYAADFRGGSVDVYDGGFHLVTAPGAFVDPKLPTGYAPFGIQNVGGHIFVAYAKPGPNGRAQPGRGLGWVDEYDASGALLARVEQHAKLNAPWGIVQAPATGFGPLSGTLIVGNFGDGRLNGYAKDASGVWQHVDQLRDANGLAVSVSGLWGIAFGKDAPNNGPSTTMFFAAGIQDETHGLFGTIRAAP